LLKHSFDLFILNVKSSDAAEMPVQFISRCRD